jgi:hypothetical protein
LLEKFLKEGPVIACPECDYKRPDPTRKAEAESVA